MPKSKKKSQSREEILERKRENERKRYARIKNDPERLSAYKEKDKQKYLKERATGVRKTISEMTDREKRQCRKSWRDRSSKYYKKRCAAKKATEDFIRANTPSSMCDEALVFDSSTPQIQSPQVNFVRSPSAKHSRRLHVGRQKSIIQRRKRNKKMKEQEKKILKLKSELNKYRKKVSKLRKQNKTLKNQSSPNSQMSQMAENPATRPEVIKKALFGDIIEQQITENLPKLKTKQEKELAKKLLLGSVVKQRKLWKTNKKLITYKKIWTAEKRKKQDKKSNRFLTKLIEEFLEDDKYSRLGAGKKEYIKKNKIKKQRRYRLDTLRNLHKEFLKTGNVVISYSLFARLQPFWIVAPKVYDRDTCMCTVHSNFQLVVTALNKAKVLKVSSYQNLLTILCCDRYNERCLERACDNCCARSIPLCDEIDESMPVRYQEWKAIRETLTDPRTKKDRTIIKQVKNTCNTSARDLVRKLENNLKPIFKHERNIVHQYQSMKRLKESLTEKDAVVHMDFSENYATKYSEEIQSYHFGGSRIQLSLHTVVVYLQNSTTSYCTVSTNLSHNVAAIWAHLQPVLEKLPENIENIHFLSDGPVTQYRNKLMFYVLASKISDRWPKFINWTWNYHEAGHGKGAPDGVGATCKRTADHIVATGGDVANLTQFCDAIQDRCPNITLFTVNHGEIEEMDKMFSREQPSLVPFKGTLQVHQVQGNAYLPQQIVMKSLSCFCSNLCDHFRLGVVKYSTTLKANVDDVFGESDSESVDVQKRPKRNLNKNVRLDQGHQVKKAKVKGKARTYSQKLKTKSSTKAEGKKKRRYGSDCDCSCIICGTLYKEDVTGQDWIQCITCGQWAQIDCIKTDPTSFTCPECLAGGD